MELKQVLERVGAVINDSHFVLKSRRHARAYVNWVAVLQDAGAVWATSCDMIRLLGDLEFDVVAGPTHTGDKVAGYLMLAFFLNTGRGVTAVYAQEMEEEGRREFPRGQDAAVRGQRVLVVDDILTSGTTLRETIEAVVKAGGTPVAVLVGCNRSSISGYFDGLPLYSLLTVSMEDWEKEVCPVCIEGCEFNTTVGHGDEFLAEYGPDPKDWPANRAA